MTRPALAITLLASACGTEPPRAPGRDVLLVSLDTTRADALGCDTDLVVAPNLCALAARGTRYTSAVSPAPTTLSAHTGVFTGLDSHGSAVPRNGWVVSPALETLAERMAAAGYQTLGVPGASVLGAKTGVSQGFEEWSEEFGVHHGRRVESVADSVTDRALALVDARDRHRPALLFVHYFDAHAPYRAPAPYGSRFADPNYSGLFNGTAESMKALVAASRRGELTDADRLAVRAAYLGEVAWVDAEVGRLLAGLAERGMEPFVVAFADHGEGLGEDRLNPFGHGGDIDPYTQHVPLIVAAPGGVVGRKVDRQARLIDVGTTVLVLAGLGGKLGEGEDLSAVALPEVAPPAFAEASQPETEAATTGWPNAPFEKGVYAEGHLLTRYPLANAADQLYRWLPSGTTPVVDPERSQRLGALLQRWQDAAPAVAPVALDAETEAQLEALGYREPKP